MSESVSVESRETDIIEPQTDAVDVKEEVDAATDGDGDGDAFKAPSLPLPATSSQAPTEKLPVITKPFKSPAELLKAKEEDLPLKYKEPAWKLTPKDKYYFDVLKEGKELGTIPFPDESSLIVVGRLISCQVQLEHPSISRHHAVLQYGDFGIDQAKGTKRQGWYVYDMGSTHGTVLNKQKVPAKQYIRLHVGHVLKFGGSTRLLILQGPEDDIEEESKLTVTQIKEKAARLKLKAKGIIKEEKNGEEGEEGTEEVKDAKTDVKLDDSAAMWGMNDDYGAHDSDEEESGGEEMDMESMQKRESYYKDDPKKVLSRFFDREGYELEFEYDEKGTGFKHQWVCRVSLGMIDTPSGHALKAEAVSTGSKKEAQVHCALEACRILDAHNILRRASQASETAVKKRNKELKDNDFYDSDEDIFLDRTGELEMKRQKRKTRLEMLEGSANSKQAETYQGLLEKLNSVKAEIEKINEEILSLGGSGPTESKRRKAEDSLDEYMVQVNREESSGEAEAQDTKIKKSRLRLQISELQKQADRFEKLARIARPVTLPALKSSALLIRPINSKGSSGDADASIAAKSKMVWVGSMKGNRFRRTAVPQPSPADKETSADEMSAEPKKLNKNDDENVEEVEEDDGETDADPIQKAVKNIQERKGKVPPEAPTHTQSHASKPKRVYTVQMPASLERTVEEDKEEQNESTPPVPVEAEVVDETEPIDEKATAAAVEPRKPRQRKNRKRKDQVEVNDYDPNDPDYAMWLPPDDQQGDGTTSLNQKLGY